MPAYIGRPWSIDPNDLPARLEDLDGKIRASLVSKTRGMPDVAAEDIKEGQEDWVAAAPEYGLSTETFAVAVGPFV